MPILQNPKWERFSQELAKGKSADDAYGIAGYKPHRQNASRLMSNDDVRRRVAEIVERSASKAQVTVDEVVAELKRLAFSNMADYFKVGDDGMPSVALKDLTREQWAAINSIETDRGLDLDKKGEPTGQMVGKVKFKLHDKRAALNDLGRFLGMFVEKVQHSGSIGSYDLSKVSDDDLQRLEAILGSAAVTGRGQG